MSQKEIKKLVLVFSLISAMLISGVAAEVEPALKGACESLCIIDCLFKRSPLCIAECIKKCKKPPPGVQPPSSDGASETDCTFSCANSSCINFISDAKKLEGCVDSCYKNCSHDPWHLFSTTIDNENLGP